MVLLSTIDICAQDSLKIYFIGYFKNESFKIFNDSDVYFIHVDKYEPNTYFLDGFNIKIPISDSLKIGDVLNIVIKRKGLVCPFYRDVKLYIQFENQDYLIVWRDFRQKNKYSFSYFWTCSPPSVNINEKFWSYSNKDWEKCTKTNNKKGMLDVRDFIY